MAGGLTLTVFLLVFLLQPRIAWADALDDAAAAYHRGEFKTALRAFQRLADEGSASAQHSLGVLYENGHGVPQDYEEAAKWHRKAAEQGHAPAQTHLAFMYNKGQGLPQDYKEAVSWYRKAADRGWANAQNNLGVMYANGQGVPQDYVTAHMWFILASTDGHESAVENRRVVAEKMTPAQIAEAQKMAREWKPPAESLGPP